MARRANGEGTIKKRTFKREDGSSYVRYYARVTVSWDGHSKRSKDGPLRVKKEEAKGDLLRLQKLQAKGTLETLAKQRLGDYLEGWLEQAALSKKFGAYRNYYYSLRTYVIPRIGHMPLDKLRRVHVQAMVNDIYREQMGRGNDGRATTRNALAGLRKGISDAIHNELLPEDRANPCFKIELPSEYTKEIVPWSRYQLLRLLAVARHTRYCPIIYTALTSGLREGELCGLKWSDLEPVTANKKRYLVVYVRRGLVAVPKRFHETAHRKMEHVHGRYFFDTPKTKKSMGSITVGEDTLRVLESHREAQALHKHKLGNRWHEFDLVFPGWGGTPQNPRALLREYKKLIARAKIPDLSFHDLRDHHSSLLQARGVELGVVSERLRHSRKSTTADKYTHVLSHRRFEGAMSLSDLLGSVAGGDAGGDDQNP